MTFNAVTVIVSVLMPVFNAERYIEQTLRSVFRQTLRDFEFIAIDDGSNDNSLKILKDYARHDRRLRVISRPNKGIVATLNEGLSLAGGKYVARIDADDTCDERRLAMQVERMDAEQELVALGSNSIVTDPDGRRLGIFAVPLTHEEIDAAHLKGQSSIHHPAVMMRTDKLKRVGGYREGFCPAEDLDLWIRLAEVGRVANLAEPLLTRRLTLDGLVATRSHQQENTIRQILIDAWARRNLPGQPHFLRYKPVSIAKRYRLWAWLAINDGHPELAREYARKAVAREPYHPSSWRLYASAIRGSFVSRR
jgi:glycosyltransferase involved in cell wall biosynthesis